MFRNGLLVFGLTLVAASMVHADRIAELTPKQQFLLAQIVVIGKVADLEADLAKVDGQNYQIAGVKIAEDLYGGKGLTHVRVGFVPVVGGGLPPGPRAFRAGFNLAPNQECCFFLRKHPKADFFIYLSTGYPLDKRQENFEVDVKSFKEMARVCNEPIAALKAKDEGDRQRAACLLVLRYRSPIRNLNHKLVQEAIPAEESKLILQALASMEWGKVDREGITTLSNIFYNLEIGERDGWKEPTPVEGQDFNKAVGAAVTKWLADNAEKYRIQRFTINDKPAK
jgi:hypothetical protein